MRTLLSLILILNATLLVSSCKQGTESAEEQQEENSPRVVRKMSENGKLSSLNPVDEQGYLNGVKVNFYEDGVTVHSRVTYAHGRKHGPAIWYFKSGAIYEETNYFQNRKNGVTRRYYETGELYEETTYDTGVELPGKKRYAKDGTLITP